MMTQGRRHSVEFEAKVALEVIRGQRTANQIAKVMESIRSKPPNGRSWRWRNWPRCSPAGGVRRPARRRYCGKTLPPDRPAQGQAQLVKNSCQPAIIAP